MSRRAGKIMFAFLRAGYYNGADTIGRRGQRTAERRTNMKLPSDGAMLLSFLNTKLRDEYSSLDELLEDCGADRGEVEEKLRALGYEYDPSRNAFR